jgi:sugar lactone lactonase YvrE
MISNGLRAPLASRVTQVEVVHRWTPVITLQPMARQPVIEGGSVSMEINAEGYPLPDLTWQVSANGHHWTTITVNNPQYVISEDGSILTVISPSGVMSGLQYRCVVKNDMGTITSATTTLAVKPALYGSPAGLAFDGAGALYVTDAALHTIHKVSETGKSSVLAGVSGTAGMADGEGIEARFNTPRGLCFSDGALLVADSGNSIIRSVDTTSGSVGANVGVQAGLHNQAAITADAHGVVIADTGNHVIARRTGADTVTILAGAKGRADYVNGPGASARFNKPSGITFASNGRFYIADTGNDAIRVAENDGSQWLVSTLADAADGLNAPVAIVASGSGENLALYVADTGNSVISEISAAGVVTPLAGYSGIDAIAGVPGFKDGVGPHAWFSRPESLAIGPDGSLYVADTGNGVIRKITFNQNDEPVVTTMETEDGGTTPPPPAPPEEKSSRGGGGAPGPCFYLGLLILAHARFFSVSERERSVGKCSGKQPQALRRDTGD